MLKLLLDQIVRNVVLELSYQGITLVKKQTGAVGGQGMPRNGNLKMKNFENIGCTIVPVIAS